MNPIELKRGSTLKLEHAAGAAVRLADGQAWLSACDGSVFMRVGELTAVRGHGTTLIHALEDALLCVEPSNGCRIEMRRRGEVAAPPPAQDDDLCIDVSDDAAAARWADVLCCTPQDLHDAVQAAGPRLGQVKRHLFAALLREYFGGNRS